MSERIDHMTYLPGMEILEDSDIMDQVIARMNAYEPEKYTEADVLRALRRENLTLIESGASRSE